MTANCQVASTGGKFSLRAEKKKVPVVCLAGTRSITTGKKKDTGGKFSLRPEKKSSSRLSGGCVGFWFWREIGSFFVVAGKLLSVQCTVVLLCQFLVLAGNWFWFYILLMYLGYRTIQFWCCVSFFGSGGK